MAGTKILLCDKTYKMVEDIRTGDAVLTWSFEEGKYIQVPILCNVHAFEKEACVIHLNFSDAVEINVVNEHGFFDFDMGKYIYLDKEAEQYIGHKFLRCSESGKLETITLLSVQLEEKIVKMYCPVSYKELSYFANGLLSIPGDCLGLFNTFKVDMYNFKYDEEQMKCEVGEYGLYNEDDFKIISRDIFEAINAKYWKVAVEKGLLTVDEICRILTVYGNDLKRWSDYNK